MTREGPGLENYVRPTSPAEDERLLREVGGLNAKLTQYQIQEDRSKFELCSLLSSIRYRRVVERTMGRAFMTWAVEVVRDKDGRPFEAKQIQAMLKQWAVIAQFPRVVELFRRGYLGEGGRNQVFPSWTRCYTASNFVIAQNHEHQAYRRLAKEYRDEYGLDPKGEDRKELDEKANDEAGKIAEDLIRNHSTNTIREMHARFRETVPSYGDEEPMVLLGATRIPKSVRDMFKAGAVKLARLHGIPRRDALTRTQEYELYAQFIEDVGDAAFGRSGKESENE